MPGLLAVAACFFLTLAWLPAKGYYPPRISFVDGKASYEPAGDVDWSEVSVNLPLLGGDRIVSQADSRIEVELGEGNFLRLGGNTDVVFGNVSGRDGDIELELGELILRVNGSARYYVHLPGASVKIKKKGYYRFSVNQEADSRVIVWKGKVEVENAVGETRVEDGQQLILGGENVPFESVSLAPGRDDLDSWSDRRDAHFASSQSVARVGGTSYVGVYDLDNNGAWDYVPSYGQVWFPSVSVGWVPFRAGRWSYYPTWGWTWVSYEPWGWLPYHYGRWYYYQPYNRWCWAPGSFSYWSPARVHFYWGSGYVGWSPYGFNFGFGSGGYYGRGGGYIDNSVTIVNNKTIINNYQEPGSGLTVVTEDDFRASRVDRSRVRTLDSQLVGSLKSGLPTELASGPVRSRPRNVSAASQTRGVDSSRAQRGLTSSFARSRTSLLPGRTASTSKAGISGSSGAPAGARQVTADPGSASRSRFATVVPRKGTDSTGSTRPGGSSWSSSSSRSRSTGPQVTTVPRSRVGRVSSRPSTTSTGRSRTFSSSSRSSLAGSSGAVRPSGSSAFSNRPSVTGSRSGVVRPSSPSRSRYSTSRPSSISGSRPSASRPSSISGSRPSMSRPSSISGSRPSMSRPSSRSSIPRTSSSPARSSSRPSAPSRSRPRQ